MPAHKNIAQIRSALLAGAVICCGGDSRTAEGQRSVPGQIRRQFDLQWSSLFFEAQGGYTGTADGSLWFQSTCPMTSEVIQVGDTNLQKFCTIGAYVGTAFVPGETIGNNAVQGLATKTATVTMSSLTGKIVFIPVTGTFASGEAVFGYTGSGTTTLSSNPATVGSGITNRYPMVLGERAVPGTGNGTQLGFQVCYQFGSTANDVTELGMYASDSPRVYGGTYKRGNPAQGRRISTMRVFSVATNAGNSLAPVVNPSLNLSLSFALQQAMSPDPTSPDGLPRITVYTTNPTNLSGIGYGAYLNPPALNPTTNFDGKCMTFGGFAVDIDGGSGISMGCVAKFGWQLTDHLPASPTIGGVVQVNSDWKYGDTELAEYYSKILAVSGKHVVFRLEIGANPVGGPYETSVSNLKESLTLICERHRVAATSAGCLSFRVLLVNPWDFVGGDGSRVVLYTQAMSQLADANGWAFYDLVGELQLHGYAEGTANTVLAAPYRQDSGHVNFPGMDLLGSLEWNVIGSSKKPRARGGSGGGGRARIMSGVR